MGQLDKEYELNHKVGHGCVVVRGFKNKKQRDEFIKMLEIDWE